jgi:hypothetical protein
MAVAELAAQGKLRPVIDRRFAFEKIVDAYRLVDSGRKKGSVVLSLDSRAGLRGGAWGIEWSIAFRAWGDSELQDRGHPSRRVKHFSGCVEWQSKLPFWYEHYH